MPRLIGNPTDTLAGWTWTANPRDANARAEHATREEVLPRVRLEESPLEPTENVTPAGSTQMAQDPVPARVTPLLRLRTGLPPRKFDVRQQFECVVTGIGDEHFEAQLSDLTDPSKPTEYIELPLDEVSPSDKPLLAPGSVLYWILGYETREGGQITRVSEMRLRRVPPWSRRAIEAAKAKAFETFKLLNQDAQSHPPQG